MYNSRTLTIAAHTNTQTHILHYASIYAFEMCADLKLNIKHRTGNI